MKKWMNISLLFFFLLLSLTVGAENLFTDFSRRQVLILLESRLPRTLAILLAGSSMAIAGSMMQTLSQNRFAGPSTTGTLEGAKLGVLLVMWLLPQTGQFGKVMGGFTMAYLITQSFFLILKYVPQSKVWDLPLFGTLFGQVIGAVAASIAYHFDLVQSMASWQQANFSQIQAGTYEWLWLLIPIMLIAYKLQDDLAVMLLGKTTALSLGLQYMRLSRLVTGLIALIVALNVMAICVLPFVGVIVPNIVRFFYGDRVRQTFFHTLLAGANLVFFCDILGRILIRPYELPVGLLISVFGGLLFLELIFGAKEAAR
ncbi:TPA: iron chelate uptake ABC transporter family permease subunit [Streptococcus suis]